MFCSFNSSDARSLSGGNFYFFAYSRSNARQRTFEYARKAKDIVSLFG